MVQTPLSPQTLYPDSDGKPMADNTLQYRWIVRLVSNLQYLLRDEVAFVAGDLQWYPMQVQDYPAPCQAPDAMVVLGRPDGDRGSYQQWKEDNVAPQVVFEILSPSNTHHEMAKKQMFYQEHGVLEMYFYDPKSYDFWGFTRASSTKNCMLVTPLNLPWTSPILQIRFELFEDGLAVFYPDGEPFKEPQEVFAERNQAQQLQTQTQAQLAQAQEQLEQAQQLQAETQVQLKRTQQLQARAFAKLQELGIDPDML
ncbi:MAG: Uma2 family endonuclease [Spirulina sp. SIO3F2]|nr:Uma2 family endonuclease [Spirulina sp. SIO3F2]